MSMPEEAEVEDGTESMLDEAAVVVVVLAVFMVLIAKNGTQMEKSI